MGRLKGNEPKRRMWMKEKQREYVLDNSTVD